MKNILKIYCLLATMLIVGCSAEGEIEVNNYTDEWLDVSVDGDFYTLEAYESVSKSFDLDDYLFSTEEKEVKVWVEGLLKWDFSETYTIKPDKTKNVYIYADAGAIKVWNNSYYSITSVYLSPSSDSYWGSDDLSGYLYYGYINSWRVTSGYWDIKVVDEYGYYDTWYDIYVAIGEVEWFTYYGYCSHKNGSYQKNKENYQFEKPLSDRLKKFEQQEFKEVQ